MSLLARSLPPAVGTAEVMGQHAALLTAYGEKMQAGSQRQKASNERQKASSERQKASGERQKASSERQKAGSERQKACGQRYKGVYPVFTRPAVSRRQYLGFHGNSEQSA